MSEVIFLIAVMLVVVIALLFLMQMSSSNQEDSVSLQSTKGKKSLRYLEDMSGDSRSEGASDEDVKGKAPSETQFSAPSVHEPYQRIDFPGLPVEANILAEKIWDSSEEEFPLEETCVFKFGVNLTRRDLLKLKSGDWINDELINFFMQMIVQRAKNNLSLPKVFAFNSFFFSSLTERGFSYVKKWTKGVDLFGQHIILVPVHAGAHWSLAVIDVEYKRIDYYDSMLNKGASCIMALKDYLIEESLDKKNSLLDASDWTFCSPKDIPVQCNGSDCGVFVCRFAEYVSRRHFINFEQMHMSYFRKRLLYEICTAQLMP